MNQRHLDLGCGDKPRNPYGAQELYGVDIRAGISADGAIIRGADLFREPIPFDTNYFDSVSAYDFLEHIPRVTVTANDTQFPFINLMNEIWRVLTPGGYFYASTPAYPHPAAFQDPTHVNIITRQTHTYFTGPEPMGNIYGFHGHFECIRCVPVRGGQYEYQPTTTLSWFGRLQQRRRERWNRFSHLVWEFSAIKNP